MFGKIVCARLEHEPDAVLLLPDEKAELDRRMEELIARNHAAAENMGQAVEDGNVWHDNSAYDAALAEMEQIDNVSKVLGGMLQNAEVIDYPEADEPQVTMGSRAEVSLDGRSAFGVYIVGQSAFPPGGIDQCRVDLVSVRSPLGIALLGAVVGAVGEYKQPDGREMTVEVVGLDQTKTLPDILTT